MYHEATYAAAEQKTAQGARATRQATDAAKAALKGRSQAADNRTLFVPLQERKHTGRRGPRDLPGDLSGHRRRHLHHRKTTMTKAEIQLVRALADKRGRTEHGLFVAEGEKLIGELRGVAPRRSARSSRWKGVFAGPEVETVGPTRHGAAVAARKPPPTRWQSSRRPATGWTCGRSRDG